MQTLRAHLKTYGPWWLYGLLGVLVLLNMLRLLR